MPKYFSSAATREGVTRAASPARPDAPLIVTIRPGTPIPSIGTVSRGPLASRAPRVGRFELGERLPVVIDFQPVETRRLHVEFGREVDVERVGARFEGVRR